MIQVQNISKSFRVARNQSFQALSDISFEINAGKVTGLIGLNGAGKTTLIRVIAGLYTPDAGNICGGHNTPRIALLSPEQGLYKTLTAEMVIRYFGVLQNPSFDITTADNRELIDILDLQSVLAKKIEALSSGWRQKILLMLTFMNAPQVILLDEPTSYLDFYGQRQLDTLLSMSKDSGKYILYASHNLYDIEKKCDTIAFIDRGKLLFCKNRELLYEEFGTNELEQIVYKVLERQ